MKSVFFGSIGAVVETSDIQRRAYNAALDEAGLGWHWDEATYRQLLNLVGGKARLRMLGKATRQGVSDAVIDRIHQRKTELANVAMAEAGLPLRPGVAGLAQAIRAGGGKLGFVTSTEAANINAIFELGHDGFTRDMMDVVIGRADISAGKPAPDAYLAALDAAGLAGEDVVAVEDTVSSALAARRAGLAVILTPGAFATRLEEADVDLLVPSLSDGEGGLRSAVAELVGLPETAAPN